MRTASSPSRRPIRKFAIMGVLPCVRSVLGKGYLAYRRYAHLAQWQNGRRVMSRHVLRPRIWKRPAPEGSKHAAPGTGHSSSRLVRTKLYTGTGRYPRGRPAIRSRWEMRSSMGGWVEKSFFAPPRNGLAIIRWEVLTSFWSSGNGARWTPVSSLRRAEA